MKVAAFLALGLTVAGAQTQECLTQAQINNLSQTDLANLASPVGPQQAALAELLRLYGIYGNQQFNLNTATGSCASRCVGASVTGRTSTTGNNAVGCVNTFTSGGITYTYVDGAYVASAEGGSSTFTTNTLGTGCGCGSDCAAKGNCCADYRTACGLANGYKYAYQIIETVNVPVPVANPVPVSVPKPYAVPVSVNNPVPVARPVLVANPVSVQVPVNTPVMVDFPFSVNAPYNVPVPVGIPVNKPVAVLVPFGVDKPVPVPVVVTINDPVNVPVNVPRPFTITESIPYAVDKPYNVPVPVGVNNPVAVNSPVGVNVPVNFPVNNPVNNPVPFPYTIQKEVQRFRDVPVPIPVPVYVNNPVPVDVLVDRTQDVNVPVNLPVLVNVPTLVGVPVDVPVSVNNPVNAPVLVNTPYSIVTEVNVPFNVPVPVRVNNPVVVDIAYTVNNPIPVTVNRPIEVIKYVNNPVPVEIQRAVAQVMVPVFLGTVETGTILTGIEGVPTAYVVEEVRGVVTNPDISQFQPFTNEAVVVDGPPQGLVPSVPAPLPTAVGLTGQCNLSQGPFDNFLCVDGFWVYTGQIVTQPVAPVATVAPVNRGFINQPCDPRDSDLYVQFNCANVDGNGFVWVWSGVTNPVTTSPVTLVPAAPATTLLPANDGILLVNGR